MKLHVLTAFLSILIAGNVFAQDKSGNKPSSSETIVLDGSKDGQTIVEIKNSKVFVNGEQVADMAGSSDLNKKIIVKNDADDKSSFPWLRDMENRFPRKAMLGVYTDKTESSNGTVVREVIPNSAAAKAGIKEGDIITKVNATSITNPEDLVNAIKTFEPGDTINVIYTRNGTSENSDVVLGRATPADIFRSYRYNTPDMPDINIPNPFRSFGDNMDNWMGNNKPKLGVQIEDAANGARIVEINKNSAAWNAGLEKGDVIYSFDGQEVKNSNDLQQAVRTSATGKKLLVIFERNGKDYETDVVLSENGSNKM